MELLEVESFVVDSIGEGSFADPMLEEDDGVGMKELIDHSSFLPHLSEDVEESVVAEGEELAPLL